MLLATACDGTPEDGSDGGVADAPTTPPDVDLATCGAIGTPCGTGCPGDLGCLANACAPMRGSCGGFAGEPCQDASLVCAFPAGSSAGICMRPDELACMCAIAPSELGDCMGQ